MARPLHQHAVVTAALETAATLLGMELVFIGQVAAGELTLARVHGHWPGLEEGRRYPLSDTFCSIMLQGAPAATSDAPRDPAYGVLGADKTLGARSYIGVPIYDEAGRLVGTLCGVDHASVPVPDTAVTVLEQLASVIAAHAREHAEAPVSISRAGARWRVVGPDDEDVADDLVTAMVLADLLSGDLTPGPRPPRPPGAVDDTAQLKVTIAQLEHALAARVTVEQAIGILAERQRLVPRIAFERLRKAARSRGRRVHDLAREVVASASDRTVPLPPELAVRRP